MAIERRVRIVQDTFADNPREAYGCLAGRMICWHRRYRIGDKHDYDPDTFMLELVYEHDSDVADEIDRLEHEVSNKLWDRAEKEGCEGWVEKDNYVEEWVRPKINGLIERTIREGYVVLPVFMYEHSGIVLSTGPFGSSWDSGQIGWIVCDKKTIDREFNGDRAIAEKSLRDEVKTYSAYVSGDVWGLIAETRDPDESDEWEDCDSCFGFYGYDDAVTSIASTFGPDFKDCEIGND